MKRLMVLFLFVVIVASAYAEGLPCPEKCRQDQIRAYTKCLTKEDPLTCQDDADVAYKRCLATCVLD